LPPHTAGATIFVVGNTRSVRIASCLVLVAGCGGDDDPFRPPGGSDAPPRVDASPDAAFDAPLIDARIDGPLGDSPPVITLTTPAPGTILRGTVRIEAVVEDPDGVMDVRATVGAQTILFTRITAGQPNFQGFMDTLPLAGLVSPTIIIRAEDTLGDSSTLGFQVILDNVGPLSSLDPSNVRVTAPLAMPMPGQDLCSKDFDPLGPDAPNDGEAVPQLFELRARIADLGNTGTLNSTLYIPNAGVANAQLYVFDDTTKPLVVDTNADGFCDAINPTIVPATVPMLANEAAVSSLAPVAPVGAGDFTADVFGGTNGGTPPACQSDPAAMAPAALCLGEPGASVVIKTPFTGVTQIYGMPVIDTFNCLGFAFDARATGISDGWACVAVLTTDGVGNTSVSAPLRICIDYDGVGNECHTPLGSSTLVGAPNCTGTVTGGVVNGTACTPRGFGQSSTPDEYELIRP
jgi:hypothetical protein